MVQDGDRVYTAASRRLLVATKVLEFSLPPEATALAMDGGEIGGRLYAPTTASSIHRSIWPFADPDALSAAVHGHQRRFRSRNVLPGRQSQRAGGGWTQS